MTAAGSAAAAPGRGRRVAVVLHGDGLAPADLALLDGCAAAVCADGGANAVLRAGRGADWIVGDLDSFDPALRPLAEARGARFVEAPARKDHTDGELALAKALALGPAELLILGAHGDRMAMVLASLDLLRAARAAGVPAVLAGRGEEVRWLLPGDEAAAPAGAVVNVLPGPGGATVDLEGLAWAHAGLRLEPGAARGVSNRAGPAGGRVRVREGAALVVAEAPGRDSAAAWLRPPDGPAVAYEFFAPFAHVPGRYEWCRIRSPTHGVFDAFIVLGPSTAEPATVYVASEAGARFLAERYPECAAHRVPEAALGIAERDGGRTVEGSLRAAEGPVREARMVLAATPGARPEQVPYGGEGRPVWGSRRWTCWGVDLALRGAAQGRVARADGSVEVLNGAEAVVTLGSFGRIAPLPPT